MAAVPFILLSSKKPNLREFWTILAGVIKFLLVLTLLPSALQGNTIELELLEIAPNLPLVLKADTFGVFFAIIASGLWILTSFYSIGYMRGHQEKKQTRYYASFAICLSSTIGIAFSGNLLTFIIFYEMLTLATYPLVIHSETKEAIAAGRKYLTYTLSAGLLLIAASGITYFLTGTLEFIPGGIFKDANLTSTMVTTLFLLFLGGVGVKAGIMPLHSWLPSAMAAPTPVSSLLHAVAVVKSGVFGVIRIVGFIFGPDVMAEFSLNNILMVLAGFTIIVASLLAFAQDNLKRRLAYSTVSQLSYIVFGAALLTETGLVGSILHISFHATMKITLFFCAGAIMVNLHKKNISELNGIAKVMPWTMGAFTIASMGLAGLPPVNGFVSKWYLASGALEGGMLVPVIIFVISGLLNVGYFFPIIHRAYFKKGGPELESHTEASPFMVVPLVGTAVLSILFGLNPNLFFNFFDLASTVASTIFNSI
jgi:multicomponent Na+:H+ antiporter subunit D